MAEPARGPRNNTASLFLRVVGLVTYAAFMTYAQASGDPEFRPAIKKEKDKMLEHGVWERIPQSNVPKGIIPVKLAWDFRIKRSGKRKARNYLLGNRLDPAAFLARSSPVCSFLAFRFLMALAVSLGAFSDNTDVSFSSGDVAAAYLYASVEDLQIYVIIPDGYEGAGETALLRKALYGSPDAGLRWHRLFSGILESDFGLERSKVDTCLFYRIGEAHFLFVLLYVDDIIVLGDKESAEALQSALNSRFDITFEPRPDDFLGVNIAYDHSGAILHMRGYIRRSVDRFLAHLEEHFPGKVDSPIGANMPGPYDNEEDEAINFPYAELLGCLMWTTNIRTEVQFVVRDLARYTQAFGQRHVVAALRVLAYLRDTAELGLVYRPDQDSVVMPSIVYPTQTKSRPQSADPNDYNVAHHAGILPQLRIFAYTDAGYANQLGTKRSTGGHVTFLNGGLVDVGCDVFKSTIPSVAEAEYLALVKGTNSLLTVSNILRELGYTNFQPTVYSDSATAIASVLSATTTAMLRHIDIGLHVVKDRVQNKAVNVSHIVTSLNLADLLSKFVRPIALFTTLRDAMVSGFGIFRREV